jgi:7-cyano-7-deazaguanine synthase
MTEMSIDQAGNMPQRGRACVLLSGGMDSVACLHWALHHYRDVRALVFAYGQPHQDAELTVAGRIARRNRVPFETIAIADALHAGILARVPAHEEGLSAGLHRAFVPGRNLVFLSLALSRACQWWPLEAISDGRKAGPYEFEIVIGSCLEDAAGFPDCRKKFMDAATMALAMAVETPPRSTTHSPNSRSELEASDGGLQLR